MESKIVYESGPFFAFQTKDGIEIRKNGPTHAFLLGIVKDAAQAKRLIDRANLHADKV